VSKLILSIQVMMNP